MFYQDFSIDFDREFSPYTKAYELYEEMEIIKQELSSLCTSKILKNIKIDEYVDVISYVIKHNLMYDMLKDDYTMFRIDFFDFLEDTIKDLELMEKYEGCMNIQQFKIQIGKLI
jgi:hypothetical protein